MEAESDQFLSANVPHFGPCVVAPATKEGEGAFVMRQVISPDRNQVVAALSDESIRVYDIDRELAPLLTLSQAHEKTITQVVLNENEILSCSNDGLVKVWDVRSGQLVGTMKNRNKDVYSVSISKYIVAGGTRSEVAFWDIRKMKEISRFNETFTDDVTRVVFHPVETSVLLAGSEDQVLCLFDLQQPNEEDAMTATFRADQPISYCDFYGDKLQNAFAVSTVSSIHLIDLAEVVCVKDIFPIKYDEMNLFQLVDVIRNGDAWNEIYTVLGNEEGIVHITAIEGGKGSVAPFGIVDTKHNSHLRSFSVIRNDMFLSCGEDGTIQIHVPTKAPPKIKESAGLEPMDEFIIENEGRDHLFRSRNGNGKGKQKEFNPF